MEQALIAVAADVREPTVAVVIGTYNQLRFIEAAIRSVAAQTYPHFDCVVVDDCSTDGSPERVERCLASLADPRFRFIRRERNGGQMATVLAGLDATGGQFVAILDGDDMWDPEFLERHVEAHLSRAGAAAMSCSDLALVDEAGALVAGGTPSFRSGDPRINPKRHSVLKVEGAGEDALVFLGRDGRGWPWSATSGMMFRRNVLEAARPKDPAAIPISADAYLARIAHAIGGTVRIERRLGCYRLHGGNLWAKNAFFGAGSRLGDGKFELELSIRLAVIDRLLDREFAGLVPRRTLTNMLLDFVGWHEALQLSESNDIARRLLAQWASPWRRRTMRVLGLLPQGVLPRALRDPARDPRRRRRGS
jgi:glycosyltransferase involved in cell wall biosynthesis